jgi:photosystem II PsbY protein
VIALLFIPALGWVAFNILQPAFNQLNRMSEIKDDAKASSGRPGGKKKRGLAGAVGMGAALSMMAAQQADAATELSQLAASDNRCSGCAMSTSVAWSFHA